MKTLILHSIISSNTVYKLNSFIASHLKKLGEVKVLFCGQTESNRKWTLHEKINFKYKILSDRSFEIGKKDLFTYFFTPFAWKEFNKFSPDNIIISGWDQFAYQEAFVWGFLKKRKITLWSGSTINEKSWRRTLTTPLVHLFVKLSSDYIAYGTRAREYLVHLGADSDKISVFLNDVNKDYFIRESRKWRKNRSIIKIQTGITTRYNFIFVGQLIKRKGIFNLVQQFEKFKRLNPNWGLVIVGYGQEEKNIQKYIKEHSIQDIFLLGTIEQYDLPKIYIVCDCLILPSTEEVFGLVVNEALYCGLKVLVSDMCGCGPDLVESGKNGYIFDTTNKLDLRSKMIKIAAEVEN